MKAKHFAAAVLLVSMLAATRLRADGGVVRFRGASGPFLVTVFTAPGVLRAGPVDVGVMVEDSAGIAVVVDATVELQLQTECGERALITQASGKRATNRLLHSAVINLPTPGRWELTVLVRRGWEQAVFKTQLQVAPPLPPSASVWPLVALPPLAALLFAGHQALRRRHLPWLE